MVDVKSLQTRRNRLEKRAKLISNKKNPTNDELHSLFNLYEAIEDIDEQLKRFGDEDDI